MSIWNQQTDFPLKGQSEDYFWVNSHRDNTSSHPLLLWHFCNLGCRQVSIVMSCQMKTKWPFSTAREEMMQKVILKGNSAEQHNRTWDQAGACPKDSPQFSNGCRVLTGHSFCPLIQRHCNHTACCCNIRWLRPTKLHSASPFSHFSHSLNDRDHLTKLASLNCLCKYPLQLPKL